MGSIQEKKNKGITEIAMAIKSYLFKSTKDDVCKLHEADKVSLQFEGIESTGIDPTTLTQLESILTGEDCYNIYEKGDYSIIHRLEDKKGPVFISSSSKLIDGLKNLTKNSKQEVLERWCQTQEMSLYGWTPQKAEHIIDWLLKTCSNALAPKEEIILLIDVNKPEAITVN